MEFSEKEKQDVKTYMEQIRQWEESEERKKEVTDIIKLLEKNFSDLVEARQRLERLETARKYGYKPLGDDEEKDADRKLEEEKIRNGTADIPRLLTEEERANDSFEERPGSIIHDMKKVHIEQAQNTVASFSLKDVALLENRWPNYDLHFDALSNFFIDKTPGNLLHYYYLTHVVVEKDWEPERNVKYRIPPPPPDEELAYFKQMPPLDYSAYPPNSLMCIFCGKKVDGVNLDGMLLPQEAYDVWAVSREDSPVCCTNCREQMTPTYRTKTTRCLGNQCKNKTLKRRLRFPDMRTFSIQTRVSLMNKLNVPGFTRNLCRKCNAFLTKCVNEAKQPGFEKKSSTLLTQRRCRLEKTIEENSITPQNVQSGSWASGRVIRSQTKSVEESDDNDEMVDKQWNSERKNCSKGFSKHGSLLPDIRPFTGDTDSSITSDEDDEEWRLSSEKRPSTKRRVVKKKQFPKNYEPVAKKPLIRSDTTSTESSAPFLPTVQIAQQTNSSALPANSSRPDSRQFDIAQLLAVSPPRTPASVPTLHQIAQHHTTSFTPAPPPNTPFCVPFPTQMAHPIASPMDYIQQIPLQQNQLHYTQQLLTPTFPVTPQPLLAPPIISITALVQQQQAQIQQQQFMMMLAEQQRASHYEQHVAQTERAVRDAEMAAQTSSDLPGAQKFAPPAGLRGRLPPNKDSNQLKSIIDFRAEEALNCDMPEELKREIFLQNLHVKSVAKAPMPLQANASRAPLVYEDLSDDDE